MVRLAMARLTDSITSGNRLKHWLVAVTPPSHSKAVGEMGIAVMRRALTANHFGVDSKMV